MWVCPEKEVLKGLKGMHRLSCILDTFILCILSRNNSCKYYVIMVNISGEILKAKIHNTI